MDITPSLIGVLPQIIDKEIFDLRGVLESEISSDQDIIKRVEVLFSKWVLALDPRSEVLTNFSATADP